MKLLERIVVRWLRTRGWTVFKRTGKGGRKQLVLKGMKP